MPIKRPEFRFLHFRVFSVLEDQLLYPLTLRAVIFTQIFIVSLIRFSMDYFSYSNRINYDFQSLVEFVIFIAPKLSKYHILQNLGRSRSKKNFGLSRFFGQPKILDFEDFLVDQKFWTLRIFWATKNFGPSRFFGQPKILDLRDFVNIGHEYSSTWMNIPLHEWISPLHEWIFLHMNEYYIGDGVASRFFGRPKILDFGHFLVDQKFWGLGIFWSTKKFDPLQDKFLQTK